MSTGNTSAEDMFLPLPSDTDLVDGSARGYINVIGMFLFNLVKLKAVSKQLSNLNVKTK